MEGRREATESAGRREGVGEERGRGSRGSWGGPPTETCDPVRTVTGRTGWTEANHVAPVCSEDESWTRHEVGREMPREQPSSEQVTAGIWSKMKQKRGEGTEMQEP